MFHFRHLSFHVLVLQCLFFSMNMNYAVVAKVVEEFVVYLKPEDNAAYFTVNGEGRDDFKVDVEF